MSAQFVPSGKDKESLLEALNYIHKSSGALLKFLQEGGELPSWAGTRVHQTAIALGGAVSVAKSLKEAQGKRRKT